MEEWGGGVEGCVWIPNIPNIPLFHSSRLEWQMRKWIGTITFMAWVLTALLAANVSAQEKGLTNGGFDSIEALIEILKEKGVVTEAEAKRFIERYRGAPPPRQDGKVIMLLPEEKEQEYVQKITEEASRRLGEDVKQVKEEAEYNKDELMRRSRVTDRRVEALEKKVTEDVEGRLRKSAWTERIRWGGDIRLRQHNDYYDNDNAALLNPADPSEVLNTTNDRERQRYRARLLVKAVVVEENYLPTGTFPIGKVEAAARISTGNEKDPVSTNDTFGDYYNKDGLVLDQAYLQWTYKPPEPFWDMLPRATLTAGRIPNPWFYTDLVWDHDLNFEGTALKIETDTLLENRWKGFVTIGAFPLQEVEFSDQDKWLYGGQMGVQYDKPLGISGKLAVAYYQFDNVAGSPNDPRRPGENDYSAPLYQQKGNTLFDINANLNAPILTALASDFNELNITAMLDCDLWYPIHINLTGDYVRNLGYEEKGVARRTGNPDVKQAVDGYQVGLTVGYPKILDFGNWKVYVFYKYVEADAVMDAFTDSDFHAGGTNAKGWILGGEFGIAKNLWLSAKWLTTDQIDGPPLSIDTLLIDLNAAY